MLAKTTLSFIVEKAHKDTTHYAKLLGKSGSEFVPYGMALCTMSHGTLFDKMSNGYTVSKTLVFNESNANLLAVQGIVNTKIHTKSTS